MEKDKYNFQNIGVSSRSKKLVALAQKSERENINISTQQNNIVPDRTENCEGKNRYCEEVIDDITLQKHNTSLIIKHDNTSAVRSSMNTTEDPNHSYSSFNDNSENKTFFELQPMTARLHDNPLSNILQYRNDGYSNLGDVVGDISPYDSENFGINLLNNTTQYTEQSYPGTSHEATPQLQTVPLIIQKTSVENSVTNVSQHTTLNYSDSDDNDVSISDSNQVNLAELNSESPLEINDISNEFQQLHKKQKKNKKTEDVKDQIRKRAEGKEYIGNKRVGKKVVGTINKECRKLKPRCDHTLLCKKSERSFLCASVSEGKREKHFSHFWNDLTWKEKQVHVRALVSSRNVLRRRTETKVKAAKLEGHDIMLENDNGEKVRVCRKFFLNTLDLGEDSFKRWTTQIDTISVEEESDTNSEVADDISKNVEEDIKKVNREKLQNLIKKKRVQRLEKSAEKKAKKNMPNERTLMTAAKKKYLEEWISLVPKVPSHYCRATSSKLYVESTFKSWNHMFKIYQNWCRENEKVYFSRKQFIFTLQKEKNIDIHKPRKDQCDTCSAYNTGNLPKEDYDAHVLKKDRSRQAKRKLVEEANDKKLVLTMDLQSVLLAPKTKASAMYYKQKLQVHDFSIYEINTKDVHLYVWHEIDGGVSSNEFTSCIIDYLSSKCGSGYEKFVLISDGCNYQNRNKVLCSALRDFAKQNSIEILQFYLEKGHTQMEVDSVHATLESFFYPPINAPSDYVCRMRMAREKQPYKIKVLNYDFFKHFSSLETNLKSLRPGKMVGETCVKDIRQLLYLPNGDIKFNLDYDNENFNLLPQRNMVSRYGVREPEKLYSNRIPITYSKYKNLQELKSVIDKDFHVFYDNLPFTAGAKKRQAHDEDDENSENERPSSGKTKAQKR